ncbi:hypothetical protein, partial [Methylobacterium sp. J-076]|uniref:hypothetical protein n=1 Tax=Methylobacterium sp. J-076 TaxID=2836655 RepID=UPI001FB9D743
MSVGLSPQAGRGGTPPFVQAPGRLRAFVRRSEGGLVLLATVVGCLSGIAVSGMTGLTQGLR